MALDTAQCAWSSDGIKFNSMGDIRRASETYLKNRRDFDAVEILRQYRQFRLNCVNTCLSLLQTAEMPEQAFISARLKRLASIYRKLRRNQLMNVTASVNQMDDIVGFRIICGSYSEALSLSRSIDENLAYRMKNYVQSQHGNAIGYRSIHALVRFDQPFLERTVVSRFEIQIRTWFQHLWACWCEGFGERAKEGFPQASSKENTIRGHLLNVSTELNQWENSNPDFKQIELLEISDLFNVAVVWYDRNRNFSYDPFGSNMAKAVRQLNYLEKQASIDSLLLIGITNQPNLKHLLRKTHPKFLRGGSLDPQYWMPTRNS